MPCYVRVVFLSPTNLHIFLYFACGPNNHDEDNNIEGNIHYDLTTCAAEGSRCAFNRLLACIETNPNCVFMLTLHNDFRVSLSNPSKLFYLFISNISFHLFS